MTSSRGQASFEKDSCLDYKNLSVRILIPGERDTIVNEKKAKAISRALIKNGMEVMLTDTSYNIISYKAEFLIEDPVLIVSAFNKGSRLDLLPPYDGYLEKLKPGEMFLFGRILINKNNQCFLAPVSIYFLTK